MHTCACTYALTHRHKKINLPKQILLSENYTNYKNVNCLTKVRYHTGMHPACMHVHVNTCTHINIDPTKSIHSEVHKFMVMAETSTFDVLHGRKVRGQNVLAEMSVAETSVAEISYIQSFNISKDFEFARQ